MPSLEPFADPVHEPLLWKGGEAAALLVHGFPGTPAEMRPLGQALHATGWTVHAPLLPGFGAEIETLFDHRHTDWVAAVDSALAAMQRDHHPVLLLGYSMGAGLALTVAALRAPDGLILLAPFWWLSTERPWTRLLWPVLRVIFRRSRPFKRLDFSNPEVREGILRFMPGVDLDDPAVQAEIRELAIPAQIFDELRSVGRHAYRAAPWVNVPTLILQGTEDPFVAPQRTRQLLQRIPGPLVYYELPAEHDLLETHKPAWKGVKQRVLEFAVRFAQTQGTAL